MRLVAAFLGVVAVLIAYRAWHSGTLNPTPGIDFRPLWDAASDLAHGRSIYTDRTFVYLPSTAAVFLPFTLLSYHSALRLDLAIETVAVGLAFALAALPVRKDWRLIAVGLAIAFAMKSELTRDTIWYGNASMLVAPLAVFGLFSFEREKWWWGCVAIVASVLIKPMLVAVLLIPLLRGRWRELVWTLGPALVLVVVLSVTLPGAGRLLHLPGYILGGSNLEGRFISANISLQGVGKRIGATAGFDLARVAMAALTLAAVVGWARRQPRAGGTAAVGTALLLTSMFAGNLAENTYLLVVTPCTVLAVCCHRKWSSLALAVPALLIVFVPENDIGITFTADLAQVRNLITGLLLYAACLFVLVDRAGGRAVAPETVSYAGAGTGVETTIAGA